MNEREIVALIATSCGTDIKVKDNAKTKSHV
jgi:hypothetical protein